MKKSLLIIVGLLIVGGGITGWQLSKNNKNDVKTSSLVGESQTNMSSMQKQFEAYKGVEFDKVFVASMIVHHLGAVQMAQMAIGNAKHQEIKDLANNIVTAQTSEITQMQSWQKTWHYTADDAVTASVVQQMQGEMDGMMSQLNGKTGDEFDKAFLSTMMMHHQEAIAMSKPAATNASHGDIKILATNIITAQTKEVNQMMGWQARWGYVTSSNPDSMSGMHM
jgi:uncharacterized protein (DUF305 family)